MNHQNETAIEKVDAIKKLILEGKLSFSEMEKRLTAAINREMAKPEEEMNIPLISACENLLWEMHADKTKHIESRKEQSFIALQAKRKKVQRTMHMQKQTLRVASVVVALVVCFLFGNLLWGHQKLISSSSQDEQQYVIQGSVSTTPVIVNKAEAEIADESPQEFATTDFGQIVSFLGYTPKMPAYIPHGWQLDGYSGIKLGTFDDFIVNYRMEGEQYLLQYEILKYYDAEFAQHAFEQNETGEMLTLSNGREIYITYNYENVIAVWIDGLDCYSLGGPISKEILLDMVDSIK